MNNDDLDFLSQEEKDRLNEYIYQKAQEVAKYLEEQASKPYKNQPLYLKERCEVWIHPDGRQMILNLN